MRLALIGHGAMGQLVDALEGRTAPPPGCLVLTFDDALTSQVSSALPVLLRFAAPATFFVMPGFRDGVHRYMSPEDFRTLRGYRNRVFKMGRRFSVSGHNSPTIP